jgi:hypothetical protein
MAEETTETDTGHTLVFPYGSVSLNAEQYKVVSADPYETQRILASAGSGKTTTITARIAWLLTNTNVTADQIVLLTFSRNSAREMLHRVRKLVGPVSLWAGTFHALANTILKQMGGAGATQQLFFIDELPVRWMQWLRTDKGRRWVGKLRYIVVDEFQDINAIQWRLLETMRHHAAKMILVGDDAQNIYTWRGSSAGFLLDFHRVVPTVRDYQLRQNYRSTEAIITVANRVMRGIPTLPWKEHMVAHNKGGQKPDVLFFWRMSDECAWIAKTIRQYRERYPNWTIAVLARNNVELYRAEEAFVHEGLKTRFLAQERTEDTEQLGATQGIVDLATFHGAKGLEWDVCFLMSLSDDRLPSRKTPYEIVGERRLFYVACTRPRQRMIMTYHGNERLLSRFVREIGYKCLTFHGLAKYALSEYEVGSGLPSLQSLLDCLDGDEWQHIRTLGCLPWNDTLDRVPLKEERLFPAGESWKMPSWADTKDFEAFVRLWSKRCLLGLRGWQEDYKDPMRERMIFTVRIFQEDKAFWEQWREEFDLMIKHFFSNTERMQPADYGDIHEWSEKRGLGWGQKEIVEATALLAKLRGQLRCLRFEKYNLEEFKVGPTNCVVPTEYRLDAYRSWKRFVNPELSWKDCLLDIWRLGCLDQVADGRHAGLFRAGAMKDYLESCIPFLECLECALISAYGVEEDLVLNPELQTDAITGVQLDFICGTKLVRICGEKRPDYYMWVESWLMAYLCLAVMNQPITQIEILHPFHGVLWKYEIREMNAAKRLYETLLKIWEAKQGHVL